MTAGYDWRERSACLDEDPELFFPIGTTGPAILQIEAAVAVCRRCEVREACLQFAVDYRIADGIWGGFPEDERRAMKRRELRQARGESQSQDCVDPEPAISKIRAAVADGWTLKDIADAAGANCHQIGRIAKGSGQVSRAMAQKIADADLSRDAARSPVPFHEGAML